MIYAMNKQQLVETFFTKKHFFALVWIPMSIKFPNIFSM